MELGAAKKRGDGGASVMVKEAELKVRVTGGKSNWQESESLICVLAYLVWKGLGREDETWDGIGWERTW